MRVSRNHWVWVCLVAAGVAGCGETAPQTLNDKDVDWSGNKAVARAQAVPPAGPSHRPDAPAAVPAGDPVMADAAAVVTPPEGARYTIYCHAYAGPDHVTVAKTVRDQLAATSGLRKWYVVHADDQSTLYYGFYRTFDSHAADDGEEARRAHAEMDQVRGLADSRGYHIFSTALWVPIDEPDPAANKAWDLTRTRGYWTLEVAVFKGTPDRKSLAVEAVKAARAEGAEAYYYHGPTASSVCIGSWPKDAAYENSVERNNYDPEKGIVVTPGKLPSSLSGQLGDVENIAPTIEYRDPTLVEASRRYPDHSVNGLDLKDPVTGKVKPEPSFLTRVPHRDELTDGFRTITSTHVPLTPLEDGDGSPARADPTAGGLR